MVPPKLQEVRPERGIVTRKPHPQRLGELVDGAVVVERVHAVPREDDELARTADVLRCERKIIIIV